MNKIANNGFRRHWCAPGFAKTGHFLEFLYASRALLVPLYHQKVAKTIAAERYSHEERESSRVALHPSSLTVCRLSDAVVLETERDLWLFLLSSPGM